jgi:hypothetical protein
LAISLTVNYPSQPPARLEFAPFDGSGATFAWIDDIEALITRVELRTSAANGRRLICSVVMEIRNGTSTTLARQSSPVAGLDYCHSGYYFIVGNRITASGYTDAMAAWRAAANTPSARRTAMEAHFLSAGHIDASLAGT